MQPLHIILGALTLAYSAISIQAQNQDDSIRIIYKNKSVTVKPQGDESTTTVKFKDTAQNKKVLVKITVSDLNTLPKSDQQELDSNAKKIIDMIKEKKDKHERKHILQTTFFPTLDIGFASAVNEVSGADNLTPKLGKSAHISLGIIRQDINLAKNKLLFSYALNLNGYFLKYADRQQVQYLNNDKKSDTYRDTINTFFKNRLDFRYLSVPVLLEFHNKDRSFNIAAGVEFSLNGSTRYVQKGETEGNDFKTKADRDIGVNPYQMAAMIRIGFEHVSFYGKYHLTDMYKSSAYASGTNPGIQLYSFGICLFGI